MELYLDSAEINEIKSSFQQLPFMTGLTTTPTFMARHGITDIDGTIVELSKIVPVLQIEALGDTAEEIVAEAKRQEALGLDRDKTVYKIPVSMEGLKACSMLVKEGFKVNIHLVYTLQQAYMAMQAGATYVCPLVGRLQDQGHDALGLVEQCVEAVNYYGYNTKIMFSSVRTIQHIRDAVELGVHTITVPWKIMKQLTDNHFTKIGTDQFINDTRLMTERVGDAISETNPTVTAETTVADCLVAMTTYKTGAVTVIDAEKNPIGIFTDGDLRRLVTEKGGDVSGIKVNELGLTAPISIDAHELLFAAHNLIKEKQVDELVVTLDGKAIGMLDVQDIVK
ncbi:CBS domain-containing protein [Flammeovirga yaeyamensis]|uniref:CBS domain-containing protein n=1 Tax=Flammeovirga yaeyamensis TaxID=367791 RepID=A0AAX1N1Z7_9BACT|nr:MULTISPECIES: transaldolase family protein [Flammeovirga]ANQ51299.1 CBS domain-containing protein [Flammeovirga sp. MY04]MBB3698353.1 TalC/MipB family fructose-6-phosphate aldolase [Flammeovirga yaeyamensis]NMF34294.1 CBS domain-containing protein [Flammeovirga yaeyamensis]QWG01277.1 CBS domain-containing protein [Flammeovirga yaeyamensis]